MNDIDIFSLVDGEEMHSSCYKIVNRNELISLHDGIDISDSQTTIESFPFGERQMLEISEEYIKDISWLF